MLSSTPRTRVAAALAVVLALTASPLRAQDEEVDEDLLQVTVWGAVSSLVEADPESEHAGTIVGFLFHTDEGETYEIVMDDMGRKLAQEAADRTDCLLEAEGVLSIDETLLTVDTFAMHFLDPYDEVVGEDEASEP